MDPRLLRLYGQELGHLREMGAEFAQQYPKIAARLAMDGTEVADPYVERLLEGFAFLAARVQLKLEAQYPEFVQRLLEVVQPNFLASVPSMMIARLQVDLADPNLAKGHRVPRHTSLISPMPRGQDTHCEFRTAHALTLWPLELVDVRYGQPGGDLPLGAMRLPQTPRATVTIRLRVHGGLRFADLPLDSLPLYVSAPGGPAQRLFELLGAAALGTAVVWRVDGLPRVAFRGPASLSLDGFEAEQALLPTADRGFDGHRLLQEYAAMPERFRFVVLEDLRARLAEVDADEIDVVVPLGRADPGLEPLVDAASLALHCTPAVNLFPKRLDRVTIGLDAAEQLLVADRTRPNDFEIHGLLEVIGYSAGNEVELRFEPMYASRLGVPQPGDAYYSLRRTLRVLSGAERRRAARTTHAGLDHWISVADGPRGSYPAEVRHLAVQALVSNRDLPMQLSAGGGLGRAWRLDALAPIDGVEVMVGPTRPMLRLAEGQDGWALVSQLGTDYLGLGRDGAQAAAALRSTLALYGSADDPVLARQFEGLTELSVTPVTRRLPGPGPMAFGRGLSIRLLVDDRAFEGSGAFLLGAVLDRWLARHASINSFTELRLASLARGEFAAFAPRAGARPLL